MSPHENLLFASLAASAHPGPSMLDAILAEVGHADAFQLDIDFHDGHGLLSADYVSHGPDWICFEHGGKRRWYNMAWITQITVKQC